MSTPLILAGDVGGTKTVLSLRAPDGAGVVRTAALPSAGHASLPALIDAFLGHERPAIAAAAFGIAGPVVGDTTWLPNLPRWPEITRAGLEASLGAPVALMNDLVATAWGVPAVPADQIVTVQAGRPEDGPVAVIAAGTGLGMAVRVVVGGQEHVMASEGGHVDYGPRDELDMDLTRWLQARLGGRVSLERVVSGGGIGHLYGHLRERAIGPANPDLDAALDALGEDRWASEAGALVAAAAAAGCVRSQLALRRFSAAYGAAAGNLALLTMATGGLYVGGGIAPRNLSTLLEGGFLAAFLDKGRYRALMERIPVYVVLEQQTALLGAVRRASALVIPKQMFS